MRSLSLVVMTVLITVLSHAQTVSDKFIQPLPSPARAVVDFDDFLTQEDFTILADDLARYDSLTGNTIVLLTLPSLTDSATGRTHTIDATALAYFNTWGIGRKATNRGVLILLVPSLQQVRITVGKGLETQLTNEKCQRIIREQLVPHFQEGDFNKGLKATIEAIKAALRQ